MGFANRDSLPRYGKGCRAGLTISTALAESIANEVVAKRRNKNQPMRYRGFSQPRGFGPYRPPNAHQRADLEWPEPELDFTMDD